MSVEIRHVRLAHEDPLLANEEYSVFCRDGKVVDVRPSGKRPDINPEPEGEGYIDGLGGMLIPSYVQASCIPTSD